MTRARVTAKEVVGARMVLTATCVRATQTGRATTAPTTSHLYHVVLHLAPAALVATPPATPATAAATAPPAPPPPTPGNATLIARLQKASCETSFTSVCVTTSVTLDY